MVKAGVIIAILWLMWGRCESNATLLTTDLQPCPICRTDVLVKRLVGYGPYVFKEPSKYDLIFVPHSREDFIVTCGKCGYTQTTEDFFKLSDAQKRQLKAARFMMDWKPTMAPAFPVRLDRAIAVNELLGRDKEFWAVFNRVLIWHLRERDPARAARIARRELDLLEHDPRLRRKERVYLQAEYSRLAGEMDAATRFFTKAQGVSINWELSMTLLIANGLCVAPLALVWWRWRRRRLVLALTGVVLIGSLLTTPRVYSRMKLSDEYLNGLIRDRVEMMKGGLDG
ncbi:MAG: hypothetical protein AB1705_09865 [Verrucomicrobiota bacterium]